MLSKEIIRKVPKVELHEHLDGGLRPETIIELAKEQGVVLPSEDPQELKEWFIRGCNEKSLVLYLETFAITTAVMQDRKSLNRVAKEEVLDLAEENVVYAEIRFAPMLHTRKGLSPEEVVKAVLQGLEAGRKETGMEFGLILCAMRHEDPEVSMRVAELAFAFSDRGVVGFDLAGGEKDYPAKKHVEAFQFIKKRNFNITIHAGEAFGVESIYQAIQTCGADRIGHGTSIIDDVTVEDGKITKAGPLANYIRDKRIPLEMCLTSNVGTGAVSSYENHPFPILLRNHFRVFLCSDNRLMSDTNLTKEMEIAVSTYGFGIQELEKLTINAMKSAFIHHEKKLDIIYNVIKKQYADIRYEYNL
ncbi:MAG: adenosine deaminase [Spirochaetales bacterium]|nr:adenosine deaminase [Candidatus Physcosoma equi]